MSYNVGGLSLNQPFRIRRIGHFGYHSPDIDATAAFLSQTLGLAISDEDDFTSRVPSLPKKDATGWFLRCGADHHTLVIGSQNLVNTREPNRKGAIVGQISWQVGSLREVVDGVDFLDRNARLRRVGRDAPGSNWHAYAYDPDGYINEIFYGMEQVGWDGRSKPKSMYDRAFQTAPTLPQIAEYQEVDNAHDRGDRLDGYRYVERRDVRFDVEGVWMPRPFKLTRLARITLYVADMEASLAFYCDTLGLKVSEQAKIHGRTCVFLRVDDEHHTLALYPCELRERFGFAAGSGFAVASYQQLVDAHRFLAQQPGVRLLDLPAGLTPGVHYGFWVQGPDQVAVQIFYGMDRVDRTGETPHPTVFPAAPGGWPETIVHGGAAWYDPPFMGPLA
jgi:catechol 2,3-dioxygenase-like lactoylglutathione lyase family enzyme